jgi:ABC-type nitrate/sulfonate/bicarbonate transport system substrate-binding protein
MPRSTTMTGLGGAAAAALVATLSLLTSTVFARAEEARLRVKMFPGPQNLALFAAQENGFFTRRHLAVDILFTTNSQELRDGLVSRAFEIAQAGVDNAVALAEVAKADVVIVAGGGNGMNQFVVRPEIASFQDLRGKKIVVDAPNTAYALLAYKVLALNGITREEYGVVPAGGCPQRLAAMRADATNAAAMLNLPCNFLAIKEGYKSFGWAVDMVGPYQADGIWAMRAWAAANAGPLVAYLQGIIQGYRWAADPANRGPATAMIARVLKLDEEIAAKSLDTAVGAKAGLARDARFDMDGFKNTLKLRAELAGGDADAAPAKYLDLSYYERALMGMR